MSDGIYESLDMETIKEIILTKKATSVELCSFIVNLAIQEGSSDNVTFLLIPVS
jgi:serine/threonine protein phosphatase PrpC